MKSEGSGEDGECCGVTVLVAEHLVGFDEDVVECGCDFTSGPGWGGFGGSAYPFGCVE